MTCGPPDPRGSFVVAGNAENSAAQRVANMNVEAKKIDRVLETVSTAPWKKKDLPVAVEGGGGAVGPLHFQGRGLHALAGLFRTRILD